MSPDIVTLETARLKLRLIPSNGGAVIDLMTFDGRTILGCSGDPNGPRQGLGCFPMTPFCGRLPGGLVDRGGGQMAALAPNLPEGGVAHGVGWLRPWRVVRRTGTEVVLGFDHAGDKAAWPWRFDCRQVIRLRGGCAAITLVTRNLDDTAMPCASGLHPYLALGPTDPSLVLDGVAADLPAPGQGRLAAGRRFRLDGGAGGRELRSSSRDWMVYRPRDRAALCLEPHHGGFDRSPIATLAPGALQSVSLIIGFD